MLRRLIAHYPLLAILALEGLLTPLALVLALVFGLAPWEHLTFTAEAVVWSVLATLPLLIALFGLARFGGPAFRGLEAMVRDMLVRLCANARPPAVLALALLAGFGEELLFRGVLQDGLGHWLPAEVAILFAALAFGLVHYVNRLYFVLATVVGVYLGLLYHVTGNLLIACLVHAFYDWAVIRIYLRRAALERRGDGA